MTAKNAKKSAKSTALAVVGELTTSDLTVQNTAGPSDEDLAAAVLGLEAKELAIAAQTSTVDVGEVDTNAGTDDGEPAEQPSFEEIYQAITDDEKLEAAKKLGAAFDSRIEWLKTAKPNNTTQAPKLDSYRKKLAMPSRAGVLIATNTDLDFLNREQQSGDRYNIYAIDKVADVVAGLAGDQMRNAINNAITKTLFAFKREGIQFTGEHAKACVSDKIRIQDQKVKKLMIQHTTDAGTAPTQASSTMQALTTLGIVVNKGSTKFPVYELTDTPATRKLEAMIAA